MFLAVLLLTPPAVGQTAPEPTSASLAELPAPTVLKARIAEQIAAAPKRGTVWPKLMYKPPSSRFYPAASLRGLEEGTALLRCRIRVTGSLEACTIASSSNFPALDAASLEWVADVRFFPQISNRKLVECDVVLPVRWEIAD